MKKLIDILKNNLYTEISYSNDTLTVFLTGSRYYEIVMTFDTEILNEDYDSNYSELDCSVDVTLITYCDDLKQRYENLDLYHVDELQTLLAEEFTKEFI